MTSEEIKTIEQLKGKHLREKFEEITGKATRSNNRPYLIKQILQAIEQPPTSPPPPPRSRAKTMKRDPRLPDPGTVLEREHGGKTILATVLENGGFEYAGKSYRSLSAIAKEATGTTWNGFLFFRLNRPSEQGRDSR